MNFNEDFPSLKKTYINTVPLSYVDDEGTHLKFNKRIFDENIIKKTCLDKKKVKEIIEKVDDRLVTLSIRSTMPGNQDLYIPDFAQELLKELMK